MRSREMMPLQRLGRHCSNAYRCVFKVLLHSLFMPSGHFAALSKEPEWDPQSHFLGSPSGFQCWAFSASDVPLGSACCIFSLHPRREPSERSSGSQSSGNALRGLSLQWKPGPKALNALWLPAGKPMDMRTVGVPSNDRGDGLLFPLPFPAIPDLLFQGRAVSGGSGAWLPGLVSISDARHQAAGVTGGCHSLKCLLSWMRNNTLRKVSPLQRSNSGREGASYRGRQPNSLLLSGCGMDRGVERRAGLGSAGRDVAVAAELRSSVSRRSEWLMADLSWAHVERTSRLLQIVFSLPQPREGCYSGEVTDAATSHTTKQKCSRF